VTPKGARPKHPRLVLTACVLASSLRFVDGSVVNVGLPTIARSFGGAEGGLQWVINAYLLPLSALLLVGGGLGGRFGSRQILPVGNRLFAAGSAGCAGAPGFRWLLAGRAVQVVGAALVLPNSLAIHQRQLRSDRRGGHHAGRLLLVGGPPRG
jgi:MFS family permease